MSTDPSPPLPSKSGPGEHAIEVDAELTGLAQLVLDSNRYVTERPEIVQGLTAVLGESVDNVVAVLATLSVGDLVNAEPLLSRYLVERIAQGESSGKRWDGYVVLLTCQCAEAETGELLFGVTYNLRQVRRIVRVGVDATVAGVTRALRPVLPLQSLSLGDIGQNPLNDLEKRLVADGLEADVVSRALLQFRSEYVAHLESDFDPIEFGERE